jgi:twitching motility two-component system response regulator PilH
MLLAKVLCVDDVAADLLNIEKIVAASGARVFTATGGADALARARAEKPNMIFLDVNMPGMDGFATLREIRKDAELKATPVVLVTSKNQKADRMWAQMQGANGYVTKPYTAEDIQAQLNTYAR